ncbi:DUF4158 domain-containing protein, partial [Nonomuraea sp. LPB2021202275-12-8]|uniref:DUF4158 domain-containing protein n=1 Tax=Nonomuraea sp. LPB2021202275-12-8 TaxID=3120159 RepID=UPI00300C5E69
MPVNFLTDEQRSRWGAFNGVPDPAQLGAFFHLDAVDRREAMAANGARNQIGYALQLGTVRFLGTFLSGPTDAPAVVVDYVAEQLGRPVAAPGRTPLHLGVVGCAAGSTSIRLYRSPQGSPPDRAFIRLRDGRQETPSHALPQDSALGPG